MDIETMIKRKKELGYSYRELSERSGLPVGTVQKVLGGITKNPRRSTLVALELALTPTTADRIAEAGMQYTTNAEQIIPGKYTRKDLDALPEDNRAELIDGVLYDMAAPSLVHQLILGELHLQFQECIRKSSKKCRVFFAPLDVVIDDDEYTVVQPDLLVVCNRDRLHQDAVYDAPDLVVEVLSPSTARKDRTKKLEKYDEAGVKEYWIVDPVKEKVIIHYLPGVRTRRHGQRIEPEGHPEEPDVALYGFEHQIPIGISMDTCSIDMKVIADQLAEL